VRAANFLNRVSVHVSPGSSVRYSYAGDEADEAGQARGRVLRDGHVGLVTKSVPGAQLPASMVEQQNMPRVIALPKQILLHLEVRRTAAAADASVTREQATAKTRASISAAISTEAIEQQGTTDLNALRKIYSQSRSGSSGMRAFSASK
jgi:hypothetical protein